MDITVKLDWDALEGPCKYGGFLDDTYKFCDGGRLLGVGNIDHGECPACKGTGRVPTQFGRDLLAFLKKYG